MSVGRRAFLQFVGGAVGGTLLSPLPWKLAEDTAKWSQNWSWRPSPERGEITEIATICRFCEGGCGIKARLVNGHRAIMLKGNPDHPVGKGGICPLGASGLQFFYAPYRIRQPLKQTAQRGDPKGLEPITWEEAIKELTARLEQLQSDGKARNLAVISGQKRSSMVDLWRHFMTAYGSPNFFTMPDQSDSRELAAQLMFGRRASFAYGLERASCVFNFGAGLVEGWGAPVRMQQLFGSWRTESPGTTKREIVQIEARGSLSASQADQWVAINPGTEALLALGLAHVIIKDQLYDKAFIDQHVFGFESWSDDSGAVHKGFKDLVLSQYGPDQVASKTGVAAAAIKELAHRFAHQKSAVATWGRGNGDHPDNIYHDLVFVALNALVGNIRPGGLLSLVPPVPLAPLPGPAGDDAVRQALLKERLDLASGNQVPLPGNAVHSFLDAVGGSSAYPIETLLVHEANPAYSLAETGLYRKALDKIGLVVSFSSYLDETAVMADLVLPNHCCLERYDDVIGLDGVPYAYYAVSAPILPPAYRTRDTGDVLLEMAKSLNSSVSQSLPWKSYQDYLKQRVKGLAQAGRGAVSDANADPAKLTAANTVKPNFKDGNALWDKLVAGACWYDAPMDPLQALSTPSGRIELACRTLPLGQAADPLYLPHFNPLTPSGSKADFPLLLIRYPMMLLSDGMMPTPPFMYKMIPDDLLLGSDVLVEVHPQTARSLGLKQGARALLQTPQGKAGVKVRVTAAARPGCVFMAQGLGHRAYDRYVRGKGVNVNDLMEVQMDPLSGLCTVWATRAQLRKA